MMSGDLDALTHRCAEAANRAEAWMLRHLAERAVIGSDLADPVRYYKWPLALRWRGRDDDALRLLGWIAHRCLTRAGDFASPRSGFHQEFHSYANLWLVWSAVELGESKLTQQTLQFLLKHQNRDTGGVPTNPTDPSMLYEDPLSSSFLGVVACALGRKDLVDGSLKHLTALLDKQSGPARFWLRTLPDGSLVTEVPEGADPTTFVIEMGRPEQCYYFFGAMCYSLARSLETFGDGEAGELAERIAGLLESVGQEALSSIWAAKVGPGCVALWSVTGEERYLELALPVIEAVLAGQTSEGYWLKEGQPWITVSAEQCAWLTDIVRRLEGRHQ